MTITTSTKTRPAVPRQANRFWIGVAVLVGFIIISTSLVWATYGLHAGVDYAMVIIIGGLATSLIDGIRSKVR